MKIATVLGTRPQFVKALMVSRALRERYREIIIHTGQHYQWNMSGEFFSGLALEPPDYHLNAGGGTPGSQLGRMLGRLEAVFQRERPDLVLVYGDSRSTLAGALAAVRVGIPLAHVEAGLRSHNQGMPEEYNRVLADHLSAILFCPSETAVLNLTGEGINDGFRDGGQLTEDVPEAAGRHIYNVGDVMYDALLELLKSGGCVPPAAVPGPPAAGDYLLATVHRAENTDKRERLAVILANLAACGERVIFPVHPRTSKRIKDFSLDCFISGPNIQVIDPVGYREMIWLIKNARKVITDSGGVQKEAFLLGVPCITLREETEWPETVARGCNVLVGCDRQLFREALDANPKGDWSGYPYGRGKASLLISRILEEYGCPG